MERILVPLDGSEFAERALDPAVSLADRTGGEVHVVSIVSDLPPVPLASGDGELVSRWFEEEKERAETYLGGVRERLLAKGGEVNVHTHVRVGPVTASIQTLAREAEVDLILLTTHGRGSWQRAWLGSVADQLLRRAEVPLLLLRDDGSGTRPFADPGYPGHVLVPLDGSEAAEVVLSPLRSVLPREGARVTLVSVLHQPFPLATTYLPHVVADEALVVERKERLREYMAGIEARVRELGVDRVESRVLVGDDVVEGILEFATAESVDMIAMSTRGRGGVARMLMGSVADKILRGADVPILTARRHEDDEG